MRSHFNEERMFTYVKGFAMGCKLPETLKALNYARKLHKGQYRKSGEPYIIHPLTMVCQAISLGIENDIILSAILLHDVVEDCNVSVNDLPCNEEVKKTVNLLTYKKPDLYFERDHEGPSIHEVKRDYYDKISESAEASIAKLFDRCHNVSSMAGTFTKQKIQEYIAETETYVLPLIKVTKEEHPEYQNVLFVLKYHIWSVLDAIKGTIQTYSEVIEHES